MKPSRRQLRKRRLYAALAVILALSGCLYFGLPLYFFYDGEGRFADHGPLSQSARYEIDLGPVDLNRAGKYTWRMSRLPAERFRVAVALEESLPAIPPGAPPDAGRVWLRLVESAGAPVIDENRPLGEWIDTRGFRFLTGDTQEVKVDERRPRSQDIGHKASFGWGTYFVADRFESYTVTFEVLVPMTTRVRARLVVQSAP
jgi:hypothetical protein